MRPVRKVTEDGVMAMGQRPAQRQADFWIATDRLAPAPAHPFYQKLNALRAAAGFDPFCAAACQPFYARKLGRPSIPPGVYFHMLMLGYFEKLDSEREIAWRCADSLALRAFLGYRVDEGAPDHSSLSRTRNRIDLETHQAVFDWVLKRLTEQGLLKGQTLGIDASTLEADAALKSIVRRDSGQSYREFLTELAKASGIETPTAEELAKFDRQRKDKSASNDDWFNPNDPEAKITKMKDGRTHFAYKNEHAVDLDTGAIVAAEIHLANEGATTAMWGTLEKAATSLQDVREDAQVQATCQAHGVADPQDELHLQATVQDKGYHSAQTLVNLEELDIRGYIAEPDRGRQRWTAEDPDEQEYKRRGQQAVYRNRRRRKRARSKRLHRRRGEYVERTFEHALDDGGMRRVWLKGRVKIAKRYLIHTAAFNLGLIMRKVTGFGTPRGWVDAARAAAEACAGWLRALRRPDGLWNRLAALFGAPPAPTAERVRAA
ncbi:MAG: transposase [Phycisphaerae bacterium]|nr:transposase [Phycisphaerae bacterium]